MKAFKDKEGKVRLFRPMENMKRFGTSCNRIALPIPDPENLLSLIKTLVNLDQDYIPTERGSSLYIRPFAISMSNVLGIRSAVQSRVTVITSPVGGYFEGEIRLGICEHYQQGSKKSANAFKIGANYAPTIQVTSEMKNRGLNQSLWLHDGYISESGATNIFFYLRCPKTKYYLY